MIELQESYDFYESKKVGLGEEFLDKIETQLKIVQKNPYSFPCHKAPYREKTIPKFPFVIVFYIDPDREMIFVSSVYHTSRNPKNKYRDIREL